MILKRVKVPADLSHSSYEAVKDGLLNPKLYVAIDDWAYAERLNVPYNIDTRLHKGTWYIIGTNGGRFNPSWERI